jgi:hypothetical protein
MISIMVYSVAFRYGWGVCALGLEASGLWESQYIAGGLHLNIDA